MKKKFFLNLRNVVLASSLLFASGMTIVACGDNSKPADDIPGEDVVDGKVTGIAVTKAPTKVDYAEGEMFSRTGLEITANLEGGGTRKLKASEYDYSPKGELATSDTKVTITYETFTCEVEIHVYGLTALSVSELPELEDVEETASYASLIEGIKVEATYGSIKKDVTTFDVYDNGAKVANLEAAVGSGTHELEFGLKDVKAPQKLTFTTLAVTGIEVSGSLNSTYALGTTYGDIKNSITVLAVFSETKKVSITTFDLIENGAVVSDLTASIPTGDHTFTVKYGEFTTSTTFALAIKNGYLIEAEDMVATEPTSGDKAYVMAKTSPDAGYAAPSTSTDTPFAVENGSSGCSGSGSLGSIHEDNVIEFHFKALADGKAVAQMRAASCWLKKDNGGWDPRWMGDIVLNEMFEAKINGEEIDITADKVLKGSGGPEVETGGVATWYKWAWTDFGEIDIKEGWNTFEFHLKTKAQLELLPVDEYTGYTKYVNCHNSYTLMNLDCVNIFLGE